MAKQYEFSMLLGNNAICWLGLNSQGDNLVSKWGRLILKNWVGSLNNWRWQGKKKCMDSNWTVTKDNCQSAEKHEGWITDQS